MNWNPREDADVRLFFRWVFSLFVIVPAGVMVGWDFFTILWASVIITASLYVGDFIKWAQDLVRKIELDEGRE